MKEDISLNELRDQICAEKEYMINLRRDFRRYSELLLQERRIVGTIEQELERFGISYTRIRATGVLGILRGTQSSSEVIALWADIDALPIQETNDVECRSQTDGVMYACGHDTHAADLSGATKVLPQNCDCFGGELRSLFQLTKETDRGVPDFVNAGAPDGTERILSLHNAPGLPPSTIGFTPGLNNAVVDHFYILVHGRAVHVPTPQLGADALYAASQIVVVIQGPIAWRSSPMEPVLLGVGKFAAGTTYNAIAEYAELEGITCTISQETRLQVREWIDQTAEQIAATSGAGVRVTWSDITSVLISDPQVNHETAEVAKGLGGHTQVVTNYPSSLDGDNSAEYQRFVLGYYAYIGTVNTDLPGTLNSLHNGSFDSDESASVLGAGLYVGYILWWLGRQEKP